MGSASGRRQRTPPGRRGLIPRFLVIVAAFVVLPAGLGCAAVGESQRALLVSGERAFRERQYGQASAQLTQFLSDVRQGPEAARAWYVRGMAAALLGQRPAAYSDLRRAIRESTDPQFVWRPEVALGVLYFEDEDWDSAGQVLSTAAERMPPAPPKDAVLYRMGLSSERLSRWDAALASYQRVRAEFPGGPYAENAGRRLQLRADHFAIQCGVFSRLENANELVRRLQRRGFEAYVRAEQRTGAEYQVVLAGRYRGYAEAIEALARVRGEIPEAVLWP